MKSRKPFRIPAMLLALLIALSGCFSCLAALPDFSTELLSPQPGNTRSRVDEYNYAWLDTVIIRDDALSILPSEVRPACEKPYRVTAGEFVKEVNEYTKLFELNTENVSGVFFDLLETLRYTLIALGLNEPDYNTMYHYLTDYGISYANSDSDFTELYTELLYSFLKNDTFYILYGKRVEIPRGVTIEHAIVIYLAEALGITLPSGVDTVTGLALLIMRQMLPEASVPVSDNPSDEEAFYWAKFAVSAKKGYQLPTGAYDEITDAQREYVDFAYFASILDVKYDIKIDPIRLWDAMYNGDETSVHLLILKTMLEEKGVGYEKNASLTELFDLACKNGCFDLEPEFYSDIYEYELTVPYECEKVWFTPFPLCTQLEGGDKEFLTLTLDGETIASGQTKAVALSGTRRQTVLLSAVYNDGIDVHKAEYSFRIRKAAKEELTTSESENGVLGSLQSAIMAALPEDNDTVKQRVGEVFNIVNGAVEALPTANTVTTYPVGEITASASAAVSSETEQTQSPETSGSDPFTTYATADTAASGDYPEIFTTYPAEDDGDSVLTKAARAITENPVVAATPVSAAAVGTAIGLILYRRRKQEPVIPENENDNDNNEID